MKYEVSLPALPDKDVPQFEGPLDLLVHLVKPDRDRNSNLPIIDPKYIPIAKITDAFMEHINQMDYRDLSEAGDFLYFASLLMMMKARALLPKEEQEALDDDETLIDQSALAETIQKYLTFKSAAHQLRELENLSFGTFYRGRMEKVRKNEEDNGSFQKTTVEELCKYFGGVLRSNADINIHTIQMENVSAEDQMQYIENYLVDNGRVLFDDLIGQDKNPMVAAVTFFALLEMVKENKIIIRQSETYGIIWVYRKKNNFEFNNEISHNDFHFKSENELEKGLSDILRNRSQLQDQVWDNSLDNVMRESLRKIDAGEKISENDLNTMLNKKSFDIENALAHQIKISSISEYHDNEKNRSILSTNFQKAVTLHQIKSINDNIEIDY